MYQLCMTNHILYKFFRMPLIFNLLSTLIFLTSIHISSSICELPQKSAFFSLRALANKDDLAQLYKSLPQSSFNFTYKDQNQVTYSIVNLEYQLQYNNHYQREEYVDNRTIGVRLGPIFVEARFDFSVEQDGEIIEDGVAYARSNLDFSGFRKQIVEADGYLEWQPIDVKNLTFTALWVIQGSSFVMSVDSKSIFEKMLNNMLGNFSNTLNQEIEKEINWYYPQKMKAFLNSEKMLAITDIPYSYRDFTLSIAHSLANFTITPQGLQVFFRFGLQNDGKEQTNCTKLPSFDEASFGGVQEIITFSSLKYIIAQSLSKGLYNVVLDKSWEVPVFQLYMGDLSNALPFASNFPSLTPITITCSSNPTNATILPFDEKSVYLELPQTCTVGNSSGNLLQVDFQLITLVELQAQAFALSARFSKFQAKSLKFTSSNPPNKQIAQMILLSLLNGLQSKETFGTKFPILQRKYPSLFLSQDYLILFDHSEIYI